MLSREEFQAIYDAGPEATYAFVCTLLERIDALEQRLQQLEGRLAQDSHNSHRPPASDGLARPKRPPPVSLREKRGRKPGAQPGHLGHTLPPVERADHYVVHAPQVCAHCGESLHDAAVVKVERRQVYDLPPERLEVTEHQGQSKRCGGCGALTPPSFPAGVLQPVQYGPRILGLGVYLQSYQLLPHASRACWRCSRRSRTGRVWSGSCSRAPAA